MTDYEHTSNPSTNDMQATFAERQQILEMMPIGALVTHVTEAKVLYVNQTFARMFHTTVEELTGAAVPDLYYDAQSRKEVLELLREHGALQNHVVMGRRFDTGEPFWVEISVNPYRIGDIPAYLVSVLEIEERQRITIMERTLPDLSQITFEQAFDVEEIQRLQDAFASATGVASIITHVDGTPITRPSNFCRLCQLVRSTDIGRANCYKSDAELGKPHPDGLAMQPCLSGGLWDAGISIHIGEQHVANWLIGQVLNDDAEVERVLEYGRSIGADPETFEKAVSEVTRMPLERFRQVGVTLTRLAKQLSDMALQNLQQLNEIRNRRRIETALGASEERYRLMVKYTRQLIYDYDLMAGKISWSGSVEELTGYTPEEYGKMDMGAWSNHIHPEDRPAALATLDKAQQAVTQYQVEYRFRKKNGDYFYAQDTGGFLTDASGKPYRMLGTLTDITERKQAEAAVRFSEDKYRSLIENTDTGFVIVDETGKVLDANAQYLRLAGYQRPEEILGRSVVEWTAKSDQEKNAAAVAQCFAQGFIRELELNYVNAAGGMTPVEINATVVEGAHGKQILTLVRDITERRRTARLQEAQYVIAQVLAGAESLDEALRMILSRICETLDWEWGEAWMIDREANVMRCTTTWNDPTAQLADFEELTYRTTFAPGIGLPGRTWLQEKPTWILDVTQDTNFPRAQMAKTVGLRSAFGFPIRTSENIIGILGFLSREIRQPDMELLQVFGAIGSQIGQYIERREAEIALAEQARLSAYSAELGAALVRQGSLREILRECCQVTVEHLDAAFTRIWTLNEAEAVLELQASAGIYTHIDGGHARVPVGQFKIGRIAQTHEPHMNNNVIHDPQVSNQEWARREGMVAFAGYPLMIGERVVGVMALFAKHALSDLTLRALKTVANNVASGIERKQAEEAMQLSEARFRDIVNSSGDWVWEVNAQGQYTYVSEKVTGVLGYTVAEMFGKTPFDLMTPDEAARIGPLFTEIVANKAPIVGLENWTVHKDGHLVCLLTDGVPILDAQGNLLGYRGVDKDITDRKRAEEELRYQTTLLAAQSEASIDGVLVISPENRVLHFNRRFLDLWEIPQALADTGSDEALLQGVLEKLCAPQEFLDKVQYLYAHQNEQSRDEIALKDGRVLDRYTSPVVDEAGRYYGRVWSFREITERIEAQRALQASEVRFRSLIENATDLISIVGADGVLTYESPSIKSLLGYEPEELIGQPVVNFIPPETVADITAVLSAVAQHPGAIQRAEYTFRHKDGSWRILEGAAQISTIPGVAGIVVNSRDVTEQVRLSAQLRESEANFRQIIQRALVGIFRSTPNGQLVEANPALLRILGHDSIESLNQVGLSSIYVNPESRRQLWQSVQQGPVSGFEALIRRPDGEIISIAISASLVYDAQGNLEYMEGTLEDITARKRAEEELRQSEARFKGLMEQSSIAMQLFDPRGLLLDANVAWERLWNTDRRQAIGQYNILTDPQSAAPALHAQLEHLFAGAVVEFPEMYYDPTVSGQLGQPRWITSKGYPLKNDAGEVMLVVFINEDVTERKHAAEALRVNEERLSLALEAGHVGIWEWWPQTGKVYYSPTWYTMLGYEVNELPQELSTWGELLHPEDAPHTNDIVMHSMQVGQNFDLRFRMKTKDGGWRWIQAYGYVTSRTPEGAAERTIGTHTDITEQLTAEQALHESEEHYRQVFRHSPVGILQYNTQLHLLDCNEQFAQILRSRLDLLIGLDLHRLRDQRVLPVLNQALAGAEGFYEGPYTSTTSGAEIWIALRTTPLHNAAGAVTGAVGIVEDITERKQAEEELRQSEERFKSLMEQASLPILVFDTDGVLQNANKAWEEMWQSPRELAIGQYNCITDPQNEKLGILPALQKALAGEPADFPEVRYDPAESGAIGLTRWIVGKAYPLKDIQGHVVSLVVINEDITERKLAESALKESQERLNAAIEGTGIALWDWNIKTGQTIFNERWAEIIGYTLAELEPTSIETWGQLTHPDDLEKSGQLLARHFAGEVDYYECEARMKHKNGEWVWVLDRGRVAEWDSEGKPMRMVGTHADITERKRTEQERERFTTQLSTAADIAGQVGAILNPDDLLRTVIPLIKERFGLYYVHVYTLDEATGALNLRAGYGEPGRIMLERGHSIPLSREASLVATAARTGKPVLVNDVRANPGFMPNALLPDTRSEVAVPAIVGGKVLGVFDVQHDVKDYFTQADLDVFQTLTAQIANALQNAELFQQQQKNEARTHSIIEVSHTGVWEHHGATNYLWCSPEYFYMLGRTPEQFVMDGSANLQETWVDLLHPEDREKASQTFADYLAGGSIGMYESIFRMRHQDGHWVWIWSRGQTLRDPDGTLTEVTLGTHIDITAQRMAEESLQMTRASVERSPDAFYWFDAQARFLNVNEATLKLLGYTREEILNLSVFDVDPTFPREAWEPLKTQLKTQGAVAFRGVNQTKAGIPVPVDVVVSYLEFGEQEIYFSIARDITRQLAAEREIRVSRQMLQEVINSLPESIFWKDKDLVYLGCNTRFAYDAGLESADQIIGKTDFEMPWQEQAEAYQADDRHVLDSGAAKLNYEETQTTPSGETIWLRTSKVPLYDADGKVYAVLGAYADITATMEAQAERTRLSAVLEATSDFVGIARPDGYGIYFNRGAREMIGLSLDADPGDYNIAMISTESEIARTMNEIIPTAIKEGTWSGESLIKALDGREIPVLMTIISIKDAAGNLQYLANVSRDITALKQAEAERVIFTTRLSTASEIAAQVQAILDPNQLLNTMISLLKERFNLYYVHVYMLEGDTLRLHAGYGEPGRLMLERGHSIPLAREQSLVATAARTQTYVLVDDVRQNPNFMPNPLLPDTRSEIAVPLVIGDQTLGVFDIQHDVPNYFTQADLDVFRTLAGQIATSLRNAQIVVKTEQQRALYDSIIANLPVAVFAVDNAFNLLVTNEAAGTLLSRPMTNKEGEVYVEQYDVVYYSTGERYPETSLPLVKSLTQGGKHSATDMAVRHPDGQLVPLMVNAGPILDPEGRQTGAVVVFSDTSDVRRAQADAERERDRAQMYLNTVGSMVVVLNSQGQVTLINPAACKTLGYTEAELLGQNWFDFTVPEPIREMVKGVFAQLMAGEIEQTEHYENEVLTRSGELRMVAWHNALLRDTSGQIIGALSSGDDITDRKRAELTAQESEARQRQILESAPVGMVVSRISDGQIFYANEQFAQLFGRPVADLLGKQTPNLYYDPVERAAMIAILQEQGAVQDYELRVKRLDNSAVFWVNIAVQHFSFAGEHAMLTMIVDISERKRAEAEAAERLEQTRLRLELTQALSEVQSEAEIYAVLVKEASLYPNTNLGILMLDSTTPEPAYVLVRSAAYQSGSPLPPDDTRYPAAEFSLSRFFKAHEAFVSDNVFADERVDPNTQAVLRAMEALSTAYIPLAVGNDMLGVIALNSPEASYYDEAKLYFYYTMAELSASAIQRARLQDNLRRSEAEARAILNAIPDIMFRLNKDGVFTSFKAQADQLALPPEHFMGKRIADILPPNVVEPTMDGLTSVIGGASLVNYEYQLQMQDGLHSYDARMVPATDNEVLTIVRDVTERRRYEEALAQQTYQLHERLKEMNCLYSVTALVDREGVTLEDVANGIVQLIPPAWQYPEITAVRITLDGQQFTTDTFAETAWRLTCPVTVAGKAIGSIEVFYLEEKPASDEGPFMKEERGLLETLAYRLGEFIERQRAIADRERFQMLLATASEIAGEVQSILDPEELLRQVITLIKERFDLYHTHVYVLDKDARQLRLHAGYGEAGRIMRERGHSIALDNERSVVARAAQFQETVVPIGNLRESPDFLPNPLLPETQSEAAIPLVAGGEVLGVLDIQHSEPNYFEQEHLDVLLTLAGQIATALRNASLYTRTREQQLYTQALLDSMAEGFASADMEGHIVDYNHAFLDLIGYTDEEIRGINFQSLTPSEYAELEARVAQRLLSGEKVESYEKEYIRKDGSRVAVLMYPSLRRDAEGHIVGLLGTALDITASKRAQQEIERMLNETRIRLEVSQLFTGNLTEEQVLDILLQLAGRYAQTQVILATSETLHGATGFRVRRSAAGDSGLTPPPAGELVTAAQLPFLQYVGVHSELISPDMQTDARINAALQNMAQAMGARAAALLPIVYGKELLGCLTAVTPHPNIFAEDPLRLYLYRTLTEQGAGALHTARLRDEVHRSLEEARVRLEVNQALSLAQTENEVLDAIIAKAGFHSDARVTLNLLDEQATEPTLVLTRSAGFESGMKGVIPLGTRFTAKQMPFVALIGPDKPFITSDILNDERADPAVRELTARQGTLSLAILPMTVGADWMGVITIAAAEKNYFERHRLHLYQTLAEQGAATLQAARLRERLNASEIKFRQMIGRALVGIFRTTMEGHVLEANPTMLKILRYESLEALNQVGLVNIYANQADRRQLWELVQRGPVSGFEVLIQRADGTQVSISISASLIYDASGQAEYMEGTFEDITDRKAAEEDRARLTAILESTSELVSTATITGQLTYLNQAGYAMLGWSPTEPLANHTIADLHPQWTREIIEKEGIPTTLEKGIWQGETALLRRDGVEIPVSQIIMAHRSASGEVIYLSTVMHDIAALKAAEAEQVRFANQLRTAAEISKQVGSILDADQLLNTVIPLLKERFDLYHAHFYMLDEESRQLVLRAGYGQVGKIMHQQGHKIPLDREQSLVARAARSGEMVLVNDVTRNPDFMPNMLLPDTRSEVALPAMIGNRVLGVFDVQADQAGFFRESDLDVLRTLAGQIANALQSAQLFEQQRKAQLAVRESAERIRAIFDAMTEGILVTNMMGNIEDMNEATLRQFGFHRTEMLGRSVMELVTRADWGRMSDSMRRTLVNGSSGIVEYQMRRKDDATFDAEMNAALLLDAEGNPRGFVAIARDITERKRAEAALLLTRASIDVATTEILWFDENGKLLDVNETACKILGYTRAELLAMSLFDLDPDFPRAALPDALAQVRANGSITLTTRHRTKDGRAFPVEVNTYPVQFGNQMQYFSFSQDITERLKIQAERERFTTQLSTAADVSGQMTTILNPQELLEVVVPLIAERFDLYHVHVYTLNDETEELIMQAGSGEAGRLMREREHKIMLEAESSLVARAARSQRPVLVNDITQEPGFMPNPLLPDTRSELAVPIVASDHVLGVFDVQDDEANRFTQGDLDVFTTLASQLATALQNARYFKEIQETAERLRELDRLKSEFLANMSHELRTPLNSILGYTEVMLMGIDGELTSEMQEDVQAIYDNGQNLLRLINDILDLTKIEAGRMVLTMEEVYLPALLEEIKTNNLGLFHRKKNPVEFIVEADEGLPILLADRVRIGQVLNNLVSNSWKFTDSGAVTIRAYRQAEWVCIAVHDTGIGITQEDLGKIFERFRQVDGSSTRRAEGTGLGLAISRHLVLMHGGRLEVESEYGKGSTFTVWLPVPKEGEISSDLMMLE